MEKKFSRRSMLAAGVAIAGGAGAAPKLGSAAVKPNGDRPRLIAGNEPIPVAFLMDDAATMIDFSGPWEVFQDTGVAQVPGFSLFTVAPSLEQLQTTGSMRLVDGRHEMTGLKFRSDYVYHDAPLPRILVIGAQKDGVKGPDPAKLEWIRYAAAKADVVMSVCTGAFILAATGLIDGMSATTHHWFFDRFEQKFPQVNLEKGKRFVDNGKFVSAGGLTSGIDAALHVVQRFYGPAATQKIADYMEYQSTGWKF